MGCKSSRCCSMCGMRRPSLTHNGDDLSRLTNGSSSTTSTISSSQKNNNITPNGRNGGYTSSYLPNIISAAEWQNGRKRKERQDSTSSITQDRKLVRSNSEEQLPNVCADGFRRVSSHEDFNKRPPPLHLKNNEPVISEEVCLKAAEQRRNELNKENGGLLIESFSPKNLQAPDEVRHSPHRDIRVNSKRHQHDDEEHERRRSNERFCRARATGGRKSVSPRKSGKYSPIMARQTDIQQKKYEAIRFGGRGFGHDDKHEMAEHTTVIDPHSIAHNNADDVVTRDPYLIDDFDQMPEDEVDDTAIALPKSPKPWESLHGDEDMPVVCQRFANNTYSHVNNDSMKSFMNLANNTRDRGGGGSSDADGNGGTVDMKQVMTKYATAVAANEKELQAVNPFVTPEERIKQINKRLTSLKKKVAAYEEHFEQEYGYRPSQADRMNDRSIKNAIGEIHKLRKEKSQIRSDPVAAMGYRTISDAGVPKDKKVDKLKETLTEIQRRLHEKRVDEDRPEKIEDLNPEQLLEEKTAVQRGLLYFESLFGRPNTREERDAARPLYDRYRVIKRLVNRNSSLTGGAVSELPTILENEALAFTTGTVTPSNDVSPPSCVQSPPSESSTSISGPSSDSNDNDAELNHINETIRTMSIDKLWIQLDIAREEKKQLRRTIKEFEYKFEESSGRKMLKSDRKTMDDTYALYKQKKAKLRLLDALVKKHMNN